MHICPCVWALEYARILGFGLILVRRQSNLWGVSATLRFGATEPDLPLFLLHLRTAFFEAHLLSPSKIWQLWVLRDNVVYWETNRKIINDVWVLKFYQVFMEPLYTIVAPYKKRLINPLLRMWFLPRKISFFNVKTYKVSTSNLGGFHILHTSHVMKMFIPHIHHDRPWNMPIIQ